MTTTATRLALLGMLAVVLLAAALAGARLHHPEPAEAGPGGAPGVQLSATSELQWARTTNEPDRVWIWVANHGAEAVRVRALELLGESFAPAGAVDKDDVPVPAGQARAFTVGYGTARCDGQVAPPLAPLSVRLVLAGSEGVPAGAEVELPLPHPDDQLARLLGNECAAQHVADATVVRFGGWSLGPGDRLHGELVVERRRGDDPVAVHDMSGNVLFRVIADQPEPVGPVGVLPPGETSLAVPVAVHTLRCDEHAVIEAKLRYLFRVWISVGDEPELPVAVELDRAGRDQLDRLLQASCGG